MITIIEREISTGGSSSTDATFPPGYAESSSNSNGHGNGEAKSSGVEEHVTSAHQRHPKKEAAGSSPAAEPRTEGKKYTTKQMEVVIRVKKCKHHEYYEIATYNLTDECANV